MAGNHPLCPFCGSEQVVELKTPAAQPAQKETCMSQFEGEYQEIQQDALAHGIPPAEVIAIRQVVALREIGDALAEIAARLEDLVEGDKQRTDRQRQVAATLDLLNPAKPVIGQPEQKNCSDPIQKP